MMYDCPTLCHHRQGFLCHRTCWRDESEELSSSEDSTIITLSGRFRLITEKNTLPFLWCQQLRFSSPQCPVFPARCSQRNAPGWMPLQDGCWPGNSSSSSKRKSRCRAFNAILCRCRFLVTLIWN
ncbi:hypothetical protein TNCV_1618731 [Trichonephila clavipes]|nr:hypothetical protein TNCV_1618731 [Trichonephila clavipes]